MEKRLTGYVTVTNPDNGEVWTGGPDHNVPGWARELITNPAAWEDAPDGPVDPDVLLRVRDYTRVQLVQAAEKLGLEVPDEASKETIAAAIKRKLFEDANPTARTSGDDPFELERQTRNAGVRSAPANEPASEPEPARKAGPAGKRAS